MNVINIELFRHRCAQLFGSSRAMLREAFQHKAVGELACLSSVSDLSGHLPPSVIDALTVHAPSSLTFDEIWRASEGGTSQYPQSTICLKDNINKE